MFVPGFQPLGFQSLGFQAGEWADEGEVAVPVEDEGSNVWQRRKRKTSAVAAPAENYDKWREAARLELQAFDDEEAIAVLLMAA